jgi:uncharacterized protein YukE
MAKITVKELQESLDDLQATLDAIGDLAEEADDAGLSREDIVQKIREISELVSGEEEEEEEGNGEGE